MKATSIFGGVQVILIGISIIRSKLVALLLGSSGFGILGILTTSINLISNITNFGLSTSAIRDVSLANNTKNHNRISIVITVLNRWLWITGILGTLVVLVLSPWLSKLSFGNDTYIWAFSLISISLLFNQLNFGKLVLLQGLQKINLLAKASIVGSFIGLLCSFPFYYFLKSKGIAPALLVSSFISFLISRYFANKINIPFSPITNKEVISEGVSMLKMGFMVSLGGLLVNLSSYLIQIYITRSGGIEQVGLYSAGFAIINTYVGLVFTGMSTDYFPRLSSVSHSNTLSRKSVNQQAEIAIIILGPILIFFIVFMKFLIVLLYSNKFYPVENMILWSALGIFFKAASWSIGYLILAKGNSRLYFWNELVSNSYVLILNILGYYFLGLEGLGISFLIGYVIYLVQLLIISYNKYHFIFFRSFIIIFLIQFLIAIISFIVVRFSNQHYTYLIGVTLLILSLIYSYIQLDKRLGVINFFKNKYRVVNEKI